MVTPALWVFVGVAAALDLRSRRIPNILIGIGLLVGFASQGWLAGFDGVLTAGIGAATALAVLIGPFALRALGGGDVKLAMVVGTFTSWRSVLAVLLLAALLCGVIAAIWWVGIRLWPTNRPPRIPVAVPVAVATISVTAGWVDVRLLGL